MTESQPENSADAESKENEEAAGCECTGDRVTAALEKDSGDRRPADRADTGGSGKELLGPSLPRPMGLNGELSARLAAVDLLVGRTTASLVPSPLSMKCGSFRFCTLVSALAAGAAVPRGVVVVDAPVGVMIGPPVRLCSRVPEPGLADMRCGELVSTTASAAAARRIDRKPDAGRDCTGLMRPLGTPAEIGGTVSAMNGCTSSCVEEGRLLGSRRRQALMRSLHSGDK